MSDFPFLDKYQWSFTKLDVCIDIVEIRFRIANGQISSIFDRVILQQQVSIFASGHNWSKYQWICALLLWRYSSGLLIGKFREFLTALSAGTHPYFVFRTVT